VDIYFLAETDCFT